jgi:exonuclease III
MSFASKRPRSRTKTFRPTHLRRWATNPYSEEKEQPDVLCLQETKVQDKDFPADPFKEMGYQPIFRQL